MRNIWNRKRTIALGFATVLGLILLLWALARQKRESGTEPTDARLAQRADTTLLLDSASQRFAGIETYRVVPATSEELIANGSITYDANRVAVVASRVEGRVVSVRADLGQEVARGGVLAVLESSEVGQTRGDLERAVANRETARRNHAREQRLFKEQITPEKEMLEAETAYRTAEADYRSAISRLRAIGAVAGNGASFSLVSPVGGTVVERNASPGQSVGPYTNLFTVADLRNVWITVDVYERDLSRIHRGSTATVVPNALTQQSFVGKVTYAGGVVDTASRTFKVRVEVGNETLRLRPGMFAQVRIQTPLIAEGAGVLTIPELAVQDVDGKKVVFLIGAAPGKFIVRQITTGSNGGRGLVTVTSGLSAGEQIVTKGAFQLKAQLSKVTLDEGA